MMRQGRAGSTRLNYVNSVVSRCAGAYFCLAFPSDRLVLSYLAGTLVSPSTGTPDLSPFFPFS